MALYVNFITTELLSDINYVENVSESYKDIRNKISERGHDTIRNSTCQHFFTKIIK